MTPVKTRTIRAVFCLFVSTFCLISCENSQQTSSKIQFSCYSPDNKTRADFVGEAKQIFGPTNFYQKVIITNKSKEISDMVLDMDHGYNARLEWVNDKLLNIIYPEGARIHHYTNYFPSDKSIRIHLSFAKSNKGLFSDLKEGCSDN